MMDQEFKENVHNFMIWLGIAGTMIVVLMFVFYFYIKYKTKKKRALEEEGWVGVFRGAEIKTSFHEVDVLIFVFLTEVYVTLKWSKKVEQPRF